MSVVAHKETQAFQTEVSRVLDLVIRSLYSNKEIFLRELISNASDAAEKLRFEALSNEGLYEDQSELAIRLTVDSEKGTLTISDNGIGMNRDEVVSNIGTIARSGTKAFIQPHPTDPSRTIRFVCLEGNENGTYFRGTAKLVNGRAEIRIRGRMGRVGWRLAIRDTRPGPGGRRSARPASRCAIVFMA